MHLIHFIMQKNAAPCDAGGRFHALHLLPRYLRNHPRYCYDASFWMIPFSSNRHVTSNSCSCFPRCWIIIDLLPLLCQWVDRWVNDYRDVAWHRGIICNIDYHLISLSSSHKNKSFDTKLVIACHYSCILEYIKHCRGWNKWCDKFTWCVVWH